MKLVAVTERLGSARFLRFGIVGAGGFVVDTVVLFVLFQRLGLPYAGARAISIFTAMHFTWMGNRLLTFRAEAANKLAAIAGEWLRFLLTNAFGAVVNWAVSNALVQWAPQPANNPYFALGAGVATGLVFNFTLSKRFVFRAISSG